MNARIACRHITRSAFGLLNMNKSLRGQFQGRADPVAIGLSADKEDFEPMVDVASIVAKKFRIIAANIDGNSHLPVVVEIRGGQAAPCNRPHEVGPQRLRRFLEMAFPQVMEHQHGFLVRNLAVVKTHVVQHGSIHLHNVGPAVVVIVEELGSDAAEQHRLDADSGAISRVGKSSVPIVVVQAVQLVRQVGDVNVEEAVAVHIRGVNAHSRFIAAILACRQPGDERRVGKSAVMVIEEKKVRPAVVGDGDVLPAIVAEVSQNYAHSF